MGLDPALTAAITQTRRRLSAMAGSPNCGADDEIFQLSLAHVLLDGAYDGVVPLSEVLDHGDHGLGTVDRLDGELVVVDGIPWQVDFTGTARILPPHTLCPFVVLTTMQSPMRRRLTDCSRDDVLNHIDAMVGDPGVIAAVRLEGTFRRVLVRSVPAQSPPYRPYAEVCATDEVRWDLKDFAGVFVGFRFPELGAEGGAIGGLHLHGLDDARSTGGHNYELEVRDAELTVSVTRDFAVGLPDRSMSDLLEMPAEVRATQRLLLRRGASTLDSLSSAMAVPLHEVEARLTWLVDRGFATSLTDAIGEWTEAPRWRATLRRSGARRTSTLTDLLLDE